MPDGSHWEAAGIDDPEMIMQLISDVVDQGEVLAEGDGLSVQWDGADEPSEESFALFCKPMESPLGYVVYLVTRQDEQRSELVSAFPMLVEGAHNRLKIQSVESLGNPIEGHLVFETPVPEMSLTLFDVLFPFNHEECEPGQEINVSVAGLVYAMRKTESDQVAIASDDIGQLIEDQNLVVEEGADQVMVSLDGMALMEPMEGAAVDYHFRTKVEAVDIVIVDEITYYRYRVNLLAASDDSVFLKGVLYAVESSIDGDRPVVGDEIEGALWLQGYKAPDS